MRRGPVPGRQPELHNGIQARAFIGSCGVRQACGAGRRHGKHKVRLWIALVGGANGWPGSGQIMVLLMPSAAARALTLPQIYTPIVPHVGDGKLPPFTPRRPSVGRDVLVLAGLSCPATRKVLGLAFRRRQ